MLPNVSISDFKTNLFTLDLKKKDVCLPFFFLFFFFWIFNFAFLNKNVKIKVSEYIVTVPKLYCVGTEGIIMFTPYMSPPDCLISEIGILSYFWSIVSGLSLCVQSLLVCPRFNNLCVRCGCHTVAPRELSGLISRALQKLLIIIFLLLSVTYLNRENYYVFLYHPN